MLWTFVERAYLAICLVGGAFVIVGIWLVDEDIFKALAEALSIEDVFYVICTSMITIGLLIFLVGAWGWAAVKFQKQWMAVVFVITLVVVIAAIFTVGVWTIASKSAFLEYAVKKLKKAVKNYPGDGTSQKLLDYVQKELHCCGATLGLADYGIQYPASCQEEFFDTPCSDPVQDWLSGKMNLAGALFLSLDGLVITGLFVCLIYDQLKEKFCPSPRPRGRH